MSQKEKSRVLDIGINRGGRYLYLDSPADHPRVGLDRIWGGLKDMKKGYPWTEGLRSDVMLPHLPFRDASFNHVDILFPHSTLLESLCYSDNMWTELQRILDPYGSFTVIFDAYKDNFAINRRTYREIEQAGKREQINNPQNQIAGFAIAKGFTVDIHHTTREALQAIGTHHSRPTIDHREEVLYEITGEKTYPSAIDKAIFAVTNKNS